MTPTSARKRAIPEPSTTVPLRTTRSCSMCCLILGSGCVSDLGKYVVLYPSHEVANGGDLGAAALLGADDDAVDTHRGEATHHIEIERAPALETAGPHGDVHIVGVAATRCGGRAYGLDAHREIVR